MRLGFKVSVLSAWCALCFGQAEVPKFLTADVRVSPKGQTPVMRPPVTRGQRYEIKNASLADLIALAYNTTIAKVVGGPSWLEMDRYDVTALNPAQTTPEERRLMLQSLLTERFQLIAREETRPIPQLALTAGPKHKLKEAEGGEPGCKPQSSNASAGSGTVRFTMGSDTGTPTTLTLTDGLVEYQCRNLTMAAFAAALRTMASTNLGQEPVIDQTGIAGTWNFDFRYSVGLLSLTAAPTEQISVAQAIEKQLGLKLETKPVPAAVVAVESANRTPGENPPGTAEALPSAVPAEFEVATVKPPGPGPVRITMQTLPTGRVNFEGLPLTLLIQRAFNPGSSTQLVGIPQWASSARFDVVAQAPEGAPTDFESVAPMLLALLKDRFKLTYHQEERELEAYDLVADKPKMKRADPAARSWCKTPAQVPGAPPAPSGQQALICQNVSMDQFAELLRGKSTELLNGAANITNLEGGWDFTLTYNPLAATLLQLASLRAAAAAQPPAAGNSPAPMAATPEAVQGVSIVEAVEKQLGLKLVKTKRSLPVTVIDHIEQTPTEN